MTPIWSRANPQLRDLAVYEPGKPIEETARELGADPSEIIKLASNENALGPSPKAATAMRAAIKSVHLYPDSSGVYLREAIAAQLGAHDYLDTNAGPPAEALQKLGGADLVLATAPDSKSMSALVDGLGPNGTLMIVGAGFESLTVTPLQLISGRKSIRGWASGTGKDSQDTLEFSAVSGVRPMIERYPLERAGEAYNQMITGKARFRAVLTFGK